jgi:hypothetical protein
MELGRLLFPKPSSGRWWLRILVAVLLLAAAPRARAGQRPDGGQENALREKANALMAASNWAEALPIWAQLYALDSDSVNLWNAAVCQYHLAQIDQATPEQALALLGQYRDSPGISEEKKARAQRYIDEMLALKARRAAAAPVPTLPPAPAPPAVTAAPPPVPVAPPSSPEAMGRGLRIGAWTAGGVGLAALAAGVYFSVRTHSLDDKVTNEETFSAADNSAGHLAETLQYTMYGVSAAALVTAGVLYYFSAGHGESRSLAVAPLPGRGQAGAVLQVRF